MSRDVIFLKHIRDNISKIQRIVSEGKQAFMSDEDRQAAVLYYLQTLAESTTRLSETLRENQPQIEWQNIRGLRNRVAHDYLSIDLELVWVIITVELAPLKTAIESMLDTQGDD